MICTLIHKYYCFQYDPQYTTAYYFNGFHADMNRPTPGDGQQVPVGTPNGDTSTECRAEERAEAAGGAGVRRLDCGGGGIRRVGR